MKKILAIFLMMPVIAFSQNNKVGKQTIDAYCLSLSELEKLLDDFDELPFIHGDSIRDNELKSMVIFINPNTKSWTIVEKNPPAEYCVTAVGKDFDSVPGDIRENIQSKRAKSKS